MSLVGKRTIYVVCDGCHRRSPKQPATQAAEDCAASVRAGCATHEMGQRMTSQPFTDFAIPRRVAADVVPLYAFEQAVSIIQGLMTECQNLATALAEATSDSAGEIAAHLAEVLDSARAAMLEIGTPPVMVAA